MVVKGSLRVSESPKRKTPDAVILSEAKNLSSIDPNRELLRFAQNDSVFFCRLLSLHHKKRRAGLSSGAPFLFLPVE